MDTPELRQSYAAMKAERDALRAQLAVAQQHILDREADEGVEIRTRAALPDDAALDRITRWLTARSADDPDYNTSNNDEAADAITALRRQLAEAQADTRRLDWLEESAMPCIEWADGSEKVRMLLWNTPPVRPVSLRESIDSAMRGDRDDK